MSAQTMVRPIATPADQAALGTLMTEPEAVLSDPPLEAPQAAGALLLLGLLLLSPETPKEPAK